MCLRVDCAMLLLAGMNYRERLKMLDSLESLKARSDAYLSGYHDAVRHVQGKVQEMHDKEFYELVRMFKGFSTEQDRIRKACEVVQLENVLEVLEDMK